MQVRQEEVEDLLFWLLVSEWERGHEVIERQGERCSRTEKRRNEQSERTSTRGTSLRLQLLPRLSYPAPLPSLASASSLELGGGQQRDRATSTIIISKSGFPHVDP